MTEGMSLSQLNQPTINMNNTEVNHNPDDKNSSEEYFDRRGGNQQQQENFQQSPFVDRSAQLRATLNSLAALNAANVVQAQNKYKTTNPITSKKTTEQKTNIVDAVSDDDKEKGNNPQQPQEDETDFEEEFDE